MSELNNINFEIQSRIIADDTPTPSAKVKVFGVGGAGGNTVNRMKQMNIKGVEYYAVNTDAMALDLSLADHKITIGEKSTKSLGAGMDPEVGRRAVEENLDEIKEAMKGADMVFVTAGMGGGTGTGAAPVIAGIARDMGILTVAVVTKPFRFEGNARSSLANEGIRNLRENADTIIVIENKKLLALVQATNKEATVDAAFKMADDVLGNAVQSICSIMFNHGLVHVDFADIRKVMLNGGNALMGTGTAQGEGRGIAAADLALETPLLEDINIAGASGVLVNVSHGENYTLLEHEQAMDHIYDIVGEEGNPNIIIGDITMPEMGEKVSITIIATGCGGSNEPRNFMQKNSSIFNKPSPYGNVNPYAAPQPTVAVPVQNPGVQRATPRPTALNFVAAAQMGAPATPMEAPAAAPEMFSRRPSIPSVAPKAEVVQEQPKAAPSVAVSTSYASENFNARVQATEEELTLGSDTSEFSALAEEDRFNGGRGGLEKPTSFKEQNLKEPAYLRGFSDEDSLKDPKKDFSIPAFMRMDESEY